MNSRIFPILISVLMSFGWSLSHSQINSSVDEVNTHSSSNRWKLGIQAGLSRPLKPNATWNSLYPTIVYDGIMLQPQGLYQELVTLLGDDFLVFGTISQNAKLAFAIRASAERAISNNWRLTCRFQYHRNKLSARQYIFVGTNPGVLSEHEAAISTHVRFYETGIMITRSFGNRKLRPYLSAGVGFTYWFEKKPQAEILGISFPVFASEQDAGFFPLIFGGGIKFEVSSPLELCLSSEVAVLPANDMTQNSVQNLTITAGVCYRL